MLGCLARFRIVIEWKSGMKAHLLHNLHCKLGTVREQKAKYSVRLKMNVVLLLCLFEEKSFKTKKTFSKRILLQPSNKWFLS